MSLAFHDPYQEFIAAKACTPPAVGFEIDEREIHPILKPHQRAIVRWMVAGGRRACFAAFGLGKSIIQLEAVRLTRARAGGMGLIVAPLGVRQEFVRDAAMLGLTITFIRRIEEATDPEGLYLTNYETIRDGKLDPAAFAVVSLDEASCLRGFGGSKTFREFMRLFGADGAADRTGKGVPYRYVATATPSPNDYIELLAYAAFLDVMDVGQAKTRFFRRNSEKADQLTLHPHKEREFWLWIASWGLFVQRPSDLGFSDEGYDLPPLKVVWHEVPCDLADGAGIEKWGQTRLFREATHGVVEAAREKRDSIPTRVAKLVEIVVSGRKEEGLSARILSEEPRGSSGEATRAEQGELCRQAGSVSRAGEALEGGEPGTDEGASDGLSGGQSGQGQCEVSRLVCGEQGAGGPTDSKAEAGEIRPDVRGVRSDAGGAEGSMPHLPDINEPAGGRSLPPVGEGSRTSLPQLQQCAGPVSGEGCVLDPCSALSDQVVVWCDLNDEQQAIQRALQGAGLTVSSLTGSQPLEEREALMGAWRDGATDIFLSKPSMYGAGVNLQQSCRMVFAGIGFKAQDILQAVHRIHRFLQQRPCEVHLIYTEAEREVRRSLERKWAQHEKMVSIMSEIIKTHGLSQAAFAGELTRALFDPAERIEVTGEHHRLVNNDCVMELRTWDEDTVDLIVTSIPFSTQYEYTPSYNDFGHTDDNAHFWDQMRFLTAELFRVLKPGRVACIHIKDRIVPGGMTGLGFQTVYPFGDDCRRVFREAGFAYLGQTTNVTDVVRENNQTYRLGWSEQCKDGTRMGVGLPEYVLRFRKPPSDASNGYADDPVVKDKADYTRARWQLDAHGYQRSSGDRLVTGEELLGLPADVVYRTFRDFSAHEVYDYAHHVRIGETLEAVGQLPPTFMLLPPQSWHPDIWTDVAQMLSLNTAQSAKGAEKHLCPLPFDIVDRLIVQFSQPGELVLDPFGGLMTVPFRALKLNRRGAGIELNPGYFLDGVAYVEAAAREKAVPSLFDLLDEPRVAA